MVANKNYQAVIDYLSPEWFRKEICDFLNKKDSIEPNTNEELIFENNIHPLIKEIMRHQHMDGKTWDRYIGSIPPRCYGDLLLNYLGRDILLLEQELRNTRYPKYLKQKKSFDNFRFELTIASTYKLYGYEIEFLSQSKSNPEFIVKNKSESLNIECKQRNQKSSNAYRANLFSKLFSEVHKTLQTFNYSNLLIRVEIFSKEEDGEVGEEIIKLISKKLTLSQFGNISKDNFIITFSHIDEHSESFVSLKKDGLFNGAYPVIDAADAFAASDPNNNAIVLSKVLNDRNVFALINDANDKGKDLKNLLVYVDLGEAPRDWFNSLSKYLMGSFKQSYLSIDGLIITKTMPEIDKGKIAVNLSYRCLTRERSFVDHIPIINPGWREKYYGES